MEFKTLTKQEAITVLRGKCRAFVSANITGDDVINIQVVKSDLIDTISHFEENTMIYASRDRNDWYFDAYGTK